MSDSIQHSWFLIGYVSATKSRFLTLEFQVLMVSVNNISVVIFKVVVSTKSPKSGKQYVWEGEANASSYTIREETDPEKLIPRGTRLTLYLKVRKYICLRGVC